MNILVQQWNGIGDFVLTLPTLEALRKVFRNAHISLEVPHPVLPLAEKLSLADSIKLLNNNERTNLSFDYGIIFTYASIVPDFNGRVGKIIEITFEDFSRAKCHMSYYLFNKVFKLLRSKKIVSQIPPFDWPHLALPQSALEKSKKKLVRILKTKSIHRCLRVAVHPGAGFQYKCWPWDNFAKIIRWLGDIEFCRVFIILGPGDRAKKLTGKKKGNIHWWKKENLLSTAALIKQCDLYIGNDSGISHVAGALKVPTVCIFGPMGPGAWGPYGKHNLVLFKSNTEIKCSRCNYATMPNCRDRRCLNQITIDNVKQAVGFQLNRLLSHNLRDLMGEEY